MSKYKNKIAATVIAIFVCAFLIALLSFIAFEIFYYKAVNFLLVAYAFLIICTIIGTVVVLVQRFREINLGEENEASKY